MKDNINRKKQTTNRQNICNIYNQNRLLSKMYFYISSNHSKKSLKGKKQYEQKLPTGISKKGKHISPLMIKEHQISTTVGFHFTPICCHKNV